MWKFSYFMGKQVSDQHWLMALQKPTDNPQVAQLLTLNDRLRALLTDGCTPMQALDVVILMLFAARKL